MRSTANARRADVRKPRGAAALAALLAIGLTAAIPDVRAQPAGEEERASSLRMRDTTITGERPTPDIFFIVPTGRGGNLRSPHRRDYRSEILQPIVKPWLEKDQHVSLEGVQHVASGTGDWRKALDSIEPIPPAPPAPVAPEPVRRPTVAMPPVARPPAALSDPAFPPPGIPQRGRSAPAVAAPPPPPAPPPPRVSPPPPPPPPARVAAPPPPPPPPPTPAAAPVPILVPPQ